MTHGALMLLMTLGMLALRQPLIVILLALCAAVHLAWGRGQLDFIVEDMWVALDKELILSIPLFMLCGSVMTRGSTARRLIRILTTLTRPLPGGLAISAVLSCGVFAAIAGSSIVTMLAIGSVMYPAMRAAGYDNRYSLGTIMAGGTLGIIIPPSIPLIIYGLVTETSVTELFLAGVGPGLLLVGIFTLYALWFNRGMPTQALDFAELRAAWREGIWALLMPVILLGGIYSGYFSTTEAAAMGLLYAILIETLVHRELKPRDMYEVVLDVSKLGGSLFPLLAVALSLNLVLIEHRVPDALVAAVQQYVSSPLTFMLIVNLLLLGVGTFMTVGEAILILAPILAPMAEAYGIGKVLFGIVMILNLEIGYLTPPAGLNLLVAMAAFKQKFGTLVRATLPYIVLMLIALAVVVWQPWIALGLVSDTT